MKNYIGELTKKVTFSFRPEQYLFNLISRMSVVHHAQSSDESISFKAYREAEALYNKTFIPLLIEIIKNRHEPKDKHIRNAAYFILAKLLQKHNDISTIQFLINQTLKESDRYIISHLLDQISDLEKPDNIDIEPILRYIENTNWTRPTLLEMR